MTKQEFDKTTFHKGMKVIYDGKEHEVYGVTFDTRYIAIYLMGGKNMFLWEDCFYFKLVKK